MVKKKIFIYPKEEFKFDSFSSKQLISYLKIQDEKLQGMLLWCSIAVLIGYILVIFAILEYYAQLPGYHTGYLAIALFLIYLLFGLFLWVQYKISDYKPTATQVRLKEFCHFKIQVTKRQIKMLSGYMVAYALILFASCIAFWLETEDDDGAVKIVRITAPVSILIYVSGLFLLAKLGTKWSALNEDMRGIDYQIIQGISQQ
jgi:MFS family permease